ncbi:hypothetical protein DXK94_07870 [Arthrobacter sp. RT-1]|nr:hypothetical protein DXK94_07870 [Arthrobacter sp. RT-1]
MRARLNGANCYEARMTNADVSGADSSGALNNDRKTIE